MFWLQSAFPDKASPCRGLLGCAAWPSIKMPDRGVGQAGGFALLSRPFWLRGREVGADGYLFPGSDLLFPLRELVAEARQGDFAEDQVQRRPRRAGGGDDGFDGLL